MDGWTFGPADAVAPAQLHEAFGAAFSDYLIGPFRLALEQWPPFLERQCADLALSRVALRDDAVLAFALVAPRPQVGHWRLATMGAPPSARGSGAAPALLDDFIARAAAAGMAGVELECFLQNDRALRLYRSRGFQPVHALDGYTGLGDAGLSEAGGVIEVDAARALAWIDAFALARGDLPLQVTPPSLRALPVRLRAWRRGTAQLVVSQAADGTLHVHSLLDANPAQADAQALVQTLMARHPASRISVPQLQRRDLGGAALVRLGFERLALGQVLMRRPL